METNMLHAVIISFAVATALYFFTKAIIRKYTLLKAFAPTPDKIEDFPQRTRELLTIFLGQKKLFQDFPAGIMHALIFWGFCVLLLRALTLFLMAFGGFDFHLPGVVH